MKALNHLVFGCLIALLVCTPIFSQPGKILYHTMIMVETHSEKNNNEDFSYQMLSISRELQKSIIGNLFYMHRIDISNNESNGGIFGVNLSRVFTKNLSANLGYQFSQTPRLKERAVPTLVSVDQDRWSINIRYTLAEYKNGLKLKGSSSFSTNTDWSAGRVLGEEISLSIPLTQQFESEIAVQYNYSLSLDESAYNVYALKLSYRLNKRAKINFGYQFVDKLTTYSNDDNVFRISYLTSL